MRVRIKSLFSPNIYWGIFLVFILWRPGIAQESIIGANSQYKIESWSLDERIGQLFFVGFRSLDQIQTLKPGGVVLFSWSLKDVETAHGLLMQIRRIAKDNLKAPLFLATDHEGGKVLRLRKGLTQFPDAQAVGATGDPLMAFRVGKIMGVELASLGFNMNFAPVMDLGNTKSFLENRVWSQSEKEVSELTRHFIRGLSSSRIISVAKHFPGHGGTSVDSHFHLPVITKSWKDLWQNDLLPFREAVKEGLEAVMTAHVEVPAVTRGPASLSSRFLKEILREQLGFKGLVISDDLEMGGLTDELNLSVEDLAVKSLVAGTDMLMVVWSLDVQSRIAARIKLAIERGEMSEELLNQKVLGILSLKQKWFGSLEQESVENPFWRENLLRSESVALVQEIYKKATVWTAGNPNQLKDLFNNSKNRSWFVVASSHGVASEWKKFRPKDKVLVSPRRPDKGSLARLSNFFSQAEQSKIPLIVITKPQASSSPEVLGLVRGHLARLEKKLGPELPLLWIHLGSKPVEIRRDPNDVRLGIVSLNTTSSAGLRRFIEDFFIDEGVE